MIITLNTVLKASAVLITVINVITLLTGGFSAGEQFSYFICLSLLFLGMKNTMTPKKE